MTSKIGFMQGRLSPIYGEKIQCFPKFHWEDEFKIANSIGLTKMEWTLDYEDIMENPLMNDSGRKKIQNLSCRYDVEIPSITGDCFMQKPFWKEENIEIKNLLDKQFDLICESSQHLKIKFLIIPLVDDGSIENSYQDNSLKKWLISKIVLFKKCKLEVLFESDLKPRDLKVFIKSFPDDFFGINYDIGNSASLGYDPDEEFFLYGDRIRNVHVKDRILGGTTVPLGEGNANFEKVFKNLSKFSYEGNLIMQTARSIDGNHISVLDKYRLMIEKWLREFKFGV